MIYFKLVELHLGQVGLVWVDKESPILIRVVLPVAESDTPSLIGQVYPDARECSHAVIDKISHKLRGYDQGKDIEFPLSYLMLHNWSEFYLSVWVETRRIPWGEVRTYGEVARRISHPDAARAVGTALGKNPFPLIIPCHRVINSKGELSGFSAGGPTVKRRLLEREGVFFNSQGRVISS